MSAIRQHAEAYLAMRRRLGFKLATFGQRLLSFVGYLEQAGISRITTDAALAGRPPRRAAPTRRTGAAG